MKRGKDAGTYGAQLSVLDAALLFHLFFAGHGKEPWPEITRYLLAVSN